MTDFGEKLRLAREERGISLRQIAANTKIAVAALEALERNDISKLPGGIFSRSFVRSYAAEVGLDPAQTVREFLDRFEAEPPPPPVAAARISDEEHAYEARRQGAMLTVKVLVGVLLAASVLLYVVLRGRPDGTASATSPAPQAGATPSASTDRAEPARAAPPAAVPAAPAPATVSGPFRIDIHPTGPCWVTVVADGQKIFSGLMQAGERKTVSVRDAAVIDVGDAGTFAFSVDGRPARSLGGAGEVRSARITRETMTQYVR